MLGFLAAGHNTKYVSPHLFDVRHPRLVFSPMLLAFECPVMEYLAPQYLMYVVPI